MARAQDSATFRAVADEVMRRRFVGRGVELERLRECALGGEPPIAWVTGAPGVGKTALATRLRGEAEALGLSAYWLPAGPVSASPPAVGAALADVGLPEGLSTLGHGAKRDVLFVDGFEHLLAVAEWFFACALSEAGANLSVVVTSRVAIPSSVEVHLGLGALVRTIELSNLGFEDAVELLRRHDVERRLEEPIYAVTGGHALALTLLARSPHLRGELEALARLPDAVAETLAREISRDAPTARHRDALVAIAVPTSCDERMLAGMLGGEAHAEYEWLRELPFVDSTPWGLAPHDVLRDALYADLGRRDAEKWRAMSRAAIDELLRRMGGLDLDAQRRLTLEGLFTRRAHPFIRDHLGLDRLRHTYVEGGTSRDAVFARACVVEHEGPRSAELFDLWYRLHPDHLFVIRDEQPQPIAAYCYIPVSSASPAAYWRDPALRRARDARINGDAPVLVGRWWFAREGYQTFGPSMAAAMFGGPMITASLRPMPRASITVTHEVDRWRPLAPSTFMELLDDGIVESDGRVLGLWVLDTSRIGPGSDTSQQLQHAYPRMLAGFASMTEPGAPAPAPIVGSTLDVDDVKRALRDLHRPHDLESHPLAARAASARGESDGARALAIAVECAIETMAESPAYVELADVLRATYLRPATKQVVAAMDLGLPWGTYRHRLRRAVEVIAKELERALAPTS